MIDVLDCISCITIDMECILCMGWYKEWVYYEENNTECIRCWYSIDDSGNTPYINIGVNISTFR